MTEKNVVTAISDALHEEMKEDDRVILFGEASLKRALTEYSLRITTLSGRIKRKETPCCFHFVVRAGSLGHIGHLTCFEVK